MEKLICTFEDDNGKICNREMTQEQDDQDGMCSRCSSLLWSFFVQPLSNGHDEQPIIFND